MNKIILIGRTTRECDVRTTQTGKTVVRVGLAVDRQNKKTAQAGQPTADFFNLTAWDRTAEIMRQYVTKGTQIAVEGHVQTGTYEKDGIKRATFDIQVDRLELLGSKRDNQAQGAPQYSQQGYQQYQQVAPQPQYQQPAPPPAPPQAPQAAPPPAQPVPPAPPMTNPMPDDDIPF